MLFRSTCPKIGLLAIISKNEAQQERLIKVDGDEDLLIMMTQAMVTMDRTFNIVEP
mgnify:FL=1